MEGQELAARHIALREQAGLTQEQEAKMAGVSPTTISGIESGKITRPHLRTLLKIAQTLGVDVGELRESGKAEAPPSPEQPDFNGLLEEERRAAAWEDAVEQARHLRGTGRARMWKTLSEWRASKGRGEPYDTRRQYLDEMGKILQEAYDANHALGWAYVQASSTPGEGSEARFPSYLREQSWETTQFYGELLGLVKGARLSVLTGEDATAAKQAAEHGQSETKPLRVEEPAA